MTTITICCIYHESGGDPALSCGGDTVAFGFALEAALAREVLDGADLPASLLDARTGVDAGTYTVSEPLTVEGVRERIADGEDLVTLYLDVLAVYATDRGPGGDLARAALAAEGK